jgi:aromatic-L-amino-acid decarboxylase
MRELVRIAGERLIRYLERLPAQRASDEEGGADAARRVIERLPENGQALETLLDLYFGELLPKGYNMTSPGALSYVTGGGIFHAALGEFIAAATNPYVGFWYAAPGCAQIEQTVVRWFCDLLGLPLEADGVLTSGGSMANLTAIVTARTALLGDDFSRGTLYASDQLHHSIQKAVAFAGFPSKNLRVVPSRESLRLDPELLVKAIERDRASGSTPFMIVATAGTTNTGAVDDLRSLAAIAERERMWLHVDAAYGGFFALTERGKARLAGIERADSIVLDPHKSLFLPFGTGCILARRADDLRRACLVHSDYLETVVESGAKIGATNAADLSPELSRSFRGLRVWLPIKLAGAQTFRRYLDEKLDVARWAADELRAMKDVEILAEPELSILAFRAAPSGRSAEELDDLNRRILEGINRRGKVHISATCVRGCYALRICVLSFRAHRETVGACLNDLREVMSAEALTRSGAK